MILYHVVPQVSCGLRASYGKAGKIKDFPSSRCSLQNQERGSAGNEIRISALPLSWFLALPSRTLYHKRIHNSNKFSRIFLPLIFTIIISLPCFLHSALTALNLQFLICCFRRKQDLDTISRLLFIFPFPPFSLNLLPATLPFHNYFCYLILSTV